MKLLNRILNWLKEPARCGCVHINEIVADPPLTEDDHDRLKAISNIIGLNPGVATMEQYDDPSINEKIRNDACVKRIKELEGKSRTQVEQFELDMLNEEFKK